jgi:hypothetical protein
MGAIVASLKVAHVDYTEGVTDQIIQRRNKDRLVVEKELRGASSLHLDNAEF